ncbi:uncharacterized protein LOC130697979 [Daphnia carinata]|uniref:uncharacterized protein LOC130697979 n=1 Tax=Daphnia carinata TaxID=120202 RepID=UPI00257C3F98|nr:uncharacterized protein LOC130697979 [Daphnia carinata]
MKHHRIAITVCSIIVLLLAYVNGQRPTVTRTTTTTTTKTETTYIETYALCASITTAVSSLVTNCRRRRNYWIDVPAYIALDEDVDDQLTQYFHPSSTYKVEPTVGPGFKTDAKDNSGWLPDGWLTASHPIQPSLLTRGTDDGSAVERTPEPIGFVALSDLANNILIALGLANPTETVLETKTNTKTTTKTTTTSTKTFYLSGCKPSPFPFTLCK